MSQQYSMGNDSHTLDAYDHPMSLSESVELFEPLPFAKDQPYALTSDSASVYSTNAPSLTFSSDGASLADTASLFSFNADISRHGYKGPLYRSNFPKKGTNEAEIRGWVPYVPKSGSGKMDKTMRTCLPCYSRRFKCECSNVPTRCLKCEDTSSYCKGPIDTPPFIDAGFSLEAAKLKLQTILKLPEASVQLTWGLVTNRSFLLEAPSGNFPYADEWPNGDQVLDTLYSLAEARFPSAHIKMYDLTQYECLCRRFCTCLALLRHIDRFSLDAEYQTYRQAFEVVTGFVSRLSMLANRIFGQIFDEIRACCAAPREKVQTPKLMSILAFWLGRMVSEITHVTEQYSRSHWKLSFQQMPDSISLTQSGLTFYARTFNNESFKAASHTRPLVLPDIHLRSPTTGDSPSKAADLCSYVMLSCPDRLLASSVSDLGLAFERQLVYPNQESMSVMNSQVDLDMSQTTIKQDLAPTNEAEAGQIACPELSNWKEAEVTRLRSHNACIKAEMEQLQSLNSQNEERIKALQRRASPHEMLTNAEHMGERDCTDIDKLDTISMSEPCEPAFNVYADSTIATTALDAMLLDFNEISASGLEFD